MSRDSSGFYEKIRKINEQNRLLAGIIEQDDRISNAPQKFTFDDLKKLLSPENFIAGILLLLWTISPALIGAISLDGMLSTIFCIYPVLSPLIWLLVGWWKPHSLAQSVSLSLVGHVLLFRGMYWNLSHMPGGGIYFIADVIGAMMILGIIVLSALGSVIVLFFAAYRSERR